MHTNQHTVLEHECGSVKFNCQRKTIEREDSLMITVVGDVLI